MAKGIGEYGLLPVCLRPANNNSPSVALGRLTKPSDHPEHLTATEPTLHGRMS
jgi:hypothetical protein